MDCIAVKISSFIVNLALVPCFGLLASIFFKILSLIEHGRLRELVKHSSAICMLLRGGAASVRPTQRHSPSGSSFMTIYVHAIDISFFCMEIHF